MVCRPASSEDGARCVVPVTTALRYAGCSGPPTGSVSTTGETHEIESSAVPLEGGDGFRGAMVFFWPVGEEVPS